MKLDSAIPQAEPSLTEKEFLQMENQFLQDELEFQELCNSFELIETIKDCIRKEGGVSSSLEIMFGENWSNNSVALEDLEKAEEGLLDFFKKKDSMESAEGRLSLISSMLQKIKSVKLEDIKDLKYPRVAKDLVYDKDKLNAIYADVKDLLDAFKELGFHYYVIEAVNVKSTLLPNEKIPHSELNHVRDYDTRLDKSGIRELAGNLKSTLKPRMKEAISIEPRTINSAEEFIQYREELAKKVESIMEFCSKVRTVSKELFIKTGHEHTLAGKAVFGLLNVILNAIWFIVRLALGIPVFILWGVLNGLLFIFKKPIAAWEEAYQRRQKEFDEYEVK